MEEDSFSAEYTRITKILGWYEGLQLAGIPEEVLARAGERGSRVHKRIEEHFDGKVATEEEYASHFGSFLQWTTAIKPKRIVGEVRLFCKILKITGKFDAILQIPGFTKLVLVDWKTSAQENPVVWRLQGGFYQFLCERNGLELDPQMIFLKLDKKGDHPKCLNFTYDQKLKDDVITILNAYRIFHACEK